MPSQVAVPACIYPADDGIGQAPSGNGCMLACPSLTGSAAGRGCLQTHIRRQASYPWGTAVRIRDAYP